MRCLSGRLNPPVNNWNVAYKGFGNYGTNHDLRAIVCYAGLGANVGRKMLFIRPAQKDADGSPYTGANKYVMCILTRVVTARSWILVTYDVQ